MQITTLEIDLATPKQLADRATSILELQLAVITSRFTSLSPSEGTAFRKGVAFCDENLGGS